MEKYIISEKWTNLLPGRRIIEQSPYNPFDRVFFFEKILEHYRRLKLAKLKPELITKLETAIPGIRRWSWVTRTSGSITQISVYKDRDGHYYLIVDLPACLQFDRYRDDTQTFADEIRKFLRRKNPQIQQHKY